MRNRTGRGRPVRAFGGFLAAALVASVAVLATGAGIASAVPPPAPPAGATNWSVIGSPTSLRQNTQGDTNVTASPPFVNPQAGVAAALQFDLPTYTAGQVIDLTLAPDDSGNVGAQCRTNPQPQGVNQSDPQEGNFVGWSAFTAPGLGEGQVGPPLVSATGVGSAPAFTFTQLDPIGCSTANPLGVRPSLADGSFATLRLTLTTSGSNGHVILGQGVSQLPLPDISGPILYDIGFGASTGPVHVFANGAEIASNATVVGQTPQANNPPSHLTRNTATDAVAGPISEFKIVENVPNALPPTDGTPGANPMGPNQFTTGNNANTHLLRASAPGAVCMVLDNGSGNALTLGLGANGWSVSPNAGTSGFSGTTGSPVVTDNGAALYLPVTSSSNVPATWTTTGLSLAGTAYADGPVYAWAYWLQGPVDSDTNAVTMPATADCSKVNMDANSAYKLGYVQIATISELANSVFGANAEATAAQAVDHQFDSSKGDCVSNTIGSNFKYGPSIFLARSDHYADGLGAAYAAGSVDSGVLLTPPNSLDPLTATQIRLQGVQTVFVAGGPLAISDAVVDQLSATESFQCGGTTPRLDPNTGQPKTLNVIRIFGQTLYDTNERLAEFVGAEPPAAFGQFGATNQFNSTSGMSTAGPAPAGPVNTALLVTGENFQDAMVASVPAYGGDFTSNIGKTGPMPLIATTPDSLSTQAQNAIFNQHIGQVLVIGGPLAVSDNVMNQLAALGVHAIRIAGGDNTETSTQLASFELSTTLGFGYLNFDPDWAAYVNRTAGNINFNPNTGNCTDREMTDETQVHCVSARVVLMTRGDTFPDAMAAAGVLSVHNGRFENPQKYPLIATVNPSTLGPAVTAFLQNASLPVSGLTGQSPARGRGNQPGTSNPAGNDCNNVSSSVFTIQPIGGPLALTPALLSQAVGLIGSTSPLVLPSISNGCAAPV